MARSNSGSEKIVFQAIKSGCWADYVRALPEVDIHLTDEDGRTLLHRAISAGSTKIALDLMLKGMDVNRQDRTGMTVLHVAATFKNQKVAAALVQNGGDPNLKDLHQNNALWTAVFNARGSYAIVVLYLQAGGNPHSKNKAGRSPLDFARQIGDDRLVSLLEGNH